jgi:hypothetical protein
MSESKAITNPKDLPAYGAYTVEVLNLDLCAAVAIFHYLRDMLGHPDMGSPDVTLRIPYEGLEPSQVQALEHFLEAGFMAYNIELNPRNTPHNPVMVGLHRNR